MFYTKTACAIFHALCFTLQVQLHVAASSCQCVLRHIFSSNSTYQCSHAHASRCRWVSAPAFSAFSAASLFQLVVTSASSFPLLFFFLHYFLSSLLSLPSPLPLCACCVCTMFKYRLNFLSLLLLVAYFLLS